MCENWYRYHVSLYQDTSNENLKYMFYWKILIENVFYLKQNVEVYISHLFVHVMKILSVILTGRQCNNNDLSQIYIPLVS